MKLPAYVLYLLGFLAFTGGGGSALLHWSKSLNASVARLRAESGLLLTAQNEASKQEEKLSRLNRDGPRMREYESSWQQRRQSYDTRDKLAEIFKAQTLASGLVPPDDPEANRVIEVGSAFFRIEWRVIGPPARVMAWMTAIEQRLDFLQVEETSWEVRDDSTVEVATLATLRLP